MKIGDKVVLIQYEGQTTDIKEIKVGEIVAKYDEYDRDPFLCRDVIKQKYDFLDENEEFHKGLSEGQFNYRICLLEEAVEEISYKIDCIEKNLNNMNQKLQNVQNYKNKVQAAVLMKK